VSPQLLSGVISDLWNKPLNAASLLVEPPNFAEWTTFTVELGLDTLLEAVEKVGTTRSHTNDYAC